MNKNFLVIAALVAGYAFLKIKTGISNLTFYFRGIGIDFENFNPIANLTFGINNPSNLNLKINAVSGSLLVGNTVIGTVSSFERVIIPKQSEGILTVKVRLSVWGVVSDIVNRIQTKSGLSYQLNFVGSVNADGILIPVNMTFAI